MKQGVDIKLLVKRACAGNTDAFGQIYDIFLDAIYRFVYFRVGSRQDAEDITEQVFMSMFTAIRHYSDKGLPFEAWMYRIARNKVTDFYRSRRQHANLDAVGEMPDRSPEPEELTQREYDKDAIAQGMRKIPDQYREFIVLKFMEEKENDEISGILQKPVAHVRVLQHRALTALKKVIRI